MPVVLSTDDAGVSRIDLTNEYFRAARDYPLGYRDAEDRSRAPRSSTRSSATPRRASALKQLDEAFRTFEQDVVKQGSLFGNAVGADSRAGSASAHLIALGGTIAIT